MGQFRRYQSLNLFIIFALELASVSGAQELAPPPLLDDRPILTLDPGMHTAIIKRADVDASGTYVVTGSDDKTIRIWSAETGELMRTLRPPRGPGDVGKIYAVAISPDATTVAAGGWTDGEIGNENVYLFDRETGILSTRIGGLPNVVNHLTFSPDGRYLAVALGAANGLRVYDRDSGWAEFARDEDYGDSTYSATFSADGRLATTADDGYLRLYDRMFRRQATLKTTDNTTPFGIAFDPEGDKLAVVYDDSTTVSLFDGHDLTPLPGPDTEGIGSGDLTTVTWSADGNTLFTGGRYRHQGIVSVLAWPNGGIGPRRELPAGLDIIRSLSRLSDNGLLIAAGDPYLAVLNADGTVRWEQSPQQADLRGQWGTLGVSTDGSVVDFGYELFGQSPARFDVGRLQLELAPPADGLTALPEQTSLKVADWVNSDRPTLDGKALQMEKREISRSLAISPDGTRFVLGADWSLRAFDAAGKPLWHQPVIGVVWAVNISGDGRLVIAAYGDGTIRWHRMDNGSELLALFPLADRRNWVAWTPEGIYAATAGAHGVLRWHVNRGLDQTGEAIAVSDIPETRRPEVIRLVLQQMGTPGAIAVAELAKIRAAIQRRTGAAAPGARLHILTVGVSKYGEAAKHLRLRFAAQDANDVAAALLNTQASLYADVRPQLLSNKDANRKGILRALNTMRESMAKSEPGRDLAVIHFSGHGALVDGEFYLFPYEVDVSDNVAITSTALPASTLRKQLELLGQYGRVLVLLDACHSGGAMANGQTLAVDATRLRSALAGTNITVLTSSTSAQLSREDTRWGNGAFTEILLEALGSKADSNRNGLISVSELTGYLTRNVPRLTAGAQSPGVEMRFDGEVFVAGL